MAQEHRASLTCLVWASRMRSSKSFTSKRHFEGRLKVQAYCLRLVGLALRDPCFRGGMTKGNEQLSTPR